jgi:hypothetical protein
VLSTLKTLINLVCVDPALPRASLEFAHVLMNHRRERRGSVDSDLEKQTDTPVVEGKSATYTNGK